MPLIQWGCKVALSAAAGIAKPTVPPLVEISRAFKAVNGLDRKRKGHDMACSGPMAEWLRRGLQILARRFDSGSGLHLHSAFRWHCPALRGKLFGEARRRFSGWLRAFQ